MLTEQHLYYLQCRLLTLVTMQYSQLNTDITCRKLLQSLTMLPTCTTEMLLVTVIKQVPLSILKVLTEFACCHYYTRFQCYVYRQHLLRKFYGAVKTQLMEHDVQTLETVSYCI